MFSIAFILLLLWSLLGSFDLTYYHDKKYALHLHVESIREHVYHTIRAICYPIIIFSIFYKNFQGIIFWLGVSAIIIDTIFFILDAFEEKNSRKKWGGLSHGESITHLFSNTFHYCAITTILLAKIYLSPSTEYPQYLSIISIIFVIGGTFTAIQHICRLYKFNL
tara:strand:- start:23 stop:517 length:495 start_codon:yes stop_codon:yes gene_type:complete